jgi:polysaccharide pyruvyl transferase WcaK-like protein
MGPTIYLGAYGFGNLGDELCLMEAMKAFPSQEAYALSVAPDWTMRCVPGLTGCFQSGPAMLALKPSRVVFGGGMFGITHAFRNWMPHLAKAAAAGVDIHLHNLGVGRLVDDLDWLDAGARGVIAGAASFTVRDYVSFEMIAEAGFDRLPGISFFPEADIEPDFTLADEMLPRGRKLLGISIIPMPLMLKAMRHDAARVRNLLREFDGYGIVPVVSTVHVKNSFELDCVGSMDFIREFLPNSDVVAPILLDRTHWHAHLTPARLKGIIARCDALLTQRKHNAIHAIGAGVRVIGLHPIVDDSLRRTLVALSHQLQPGSRCVGLHAPTEVAA